MRYMVLRLSIVVVSDCKYTLFPPNGQLHGCLFLAWRGFAPALGLRGRGGIARRRGLRGVWGGGRRLPLCCVACSLPVCERLLKPPPCGPLRSLSLTCWLSEGWQNVPFRLAKRPVLGRKTAHFGLRNDPFRKPKRRTLLVVNVCLQRRAARMGSEPLSLEARLWVSLARFSPFLCRFPDKTMYLCNWQ